jgi:hypothetical protein
MGGPNAGEDDLSDRYLAISYHTDHAAFITLDVDSGRYYLMDACGADETCPIGENVEDLLEYLWTRRIPPITSMPRSQGCE